MTYKQAKNLKIGDWVGVRCTNMINGAEDGIVINILNTGKNQLVFDIMFESYGLMRHVSHKNLNPRCLWIGGGRFGSRNFEEALRCPYVIDNNIMRISNDELFAAWGISNPT